MAEDQCTPLGGSHYAPGAMPLSNGCCLCDHGCDHSAEPAGVDCQSGYYDNFQSDGSCMEFSTMAIECDVSHAACDAKGSGFYWYNPGFVGGSGCCHCYSSCNHNLETAADCTYYETGHPPTPSPSVSPKPSTSPTPGQLCRRPSDRHQSGRRRCNCDYRGRPRRRRRRRRRRRAPLSETRM